MTSTPSSSPPPSSTDDDDDDAPPPRKRARTHSSPSPTSLPPSPRINVPPPPQPQPQQRAVATAANLPLPAQPQQQQRPQSLLFPPFDTSARDVNLFGLYSTLLRVAMTAAKRARDVELRLVPFCRDAIVVAVAALCDTRVDAVVADLQRLSARMRASGCWEPRFRDEGAADVEVASIRTVLELRVGARAPPCRHTCFKISPFLTHRRAAREEPENAIITTMQTGLAALSTALARKEEDRRQRQDIQMLILAHMRQTHGEMHPSWASGFAWHTTAKDFLVAPPY